MHKNIAVAHLEIIEKAGVVTQVIETINTDHAPLKIQFDFLEKYSILISRNKYRREII